MNCAFGALSLSERLFLSLHRYIVSIVDFGLCRRPAVKINETLYCRDMALFLINITN